MRTLSFILGLLLCSSSSFAQIKITETFDGAGRLDWNEHATKQTSALIKMGALDIEVMEKDYITWCLADLPIIAEYDFKITAKLIVPKIAETDSFGILIDMDKDFNMTAFLFTENKFKACKFNDGKFLTNVGAERHIKLPKGKDRQMEVVIERRGGKYIISYDNIDTFKWSADITSPTLGFITSSHLKVDELIIEQQYSGK